MAKKSPPIAKITRPTLSKVFPRVRLFKMLDLSNRPVTWISGPPGSGKTTLVASFLSARKLPGLWYQIDGGDADVASFFYYMGLAAKKAAPSYKRPLPLFTPEYGFGVPTFTRRYLENLCSRLKPSSVLVFDNYQEIPSDSTFHEIVRVGMSALPETITAVIISRSDPPAAFAAMHAEDKLRVIGWNDLRLTLEETKGIAKLRDIGRPPAGLYEWLHEKTDGWTAGLVLLSRLLKTEGIDPDALKNLAPENVFDYFAYELFDRLDRPLQEFLLKTAFVPRITPGLAEGLTGNSAAGKILSSLNRRNYFTEKRAQPEVVFQYHALFREFLITHAANRFSSEELSGLRLEAAKLLEFSGQTEDAAGLLMQAKAWKELTALITANAKTLFGQGRYKLLEAWITTLPEEWLTADSWLNYWMGSCRLASNPRESRGFFERAFQLFVSSRDEAGALLAWSGAVQTFLYEFDDFRLLDRWIAWLDEYKRKGAFLPSPEIALSVAAGMTAALSWRDPIHPDMQEWADKALSLSKTSSNIEACTRAYTNVAVYQIWMGRFDECGILIRELKQMIASRPVSPLRSIVLKHTEAMFYNTSAEFQQQAQRSVTEGLEVAQKTGVYVVAPLLYNQGVIGSLNAGNPGRAEEYISMLEKTLRAGSRLHAGHYYYLLACCYLYTGKLSQAVFSARTSLDLLRETGVPVSDVLARLVLSHVLHETGNEEDADRELAAAKRAVAQTGSSYFEYLYHLTGAFFMFARENERDGLKSLRKAMILGRQKGFTTLLYFWRPAVMGRLCGKALKAGIEVGYVRHLIRKLNLVPDEQSMMLEDWPWPLKIITLGRFEILADDKPVHFSKKVQKKPLELLKTIIAFGGKDVREEKLLDALWQEAEGDAAQTAFRTTMHRLRKLIGSQNVVTVQDGMINLDPRYCWVDAWAFEQTVLSAVESGKKQKTNQIEEPGIHLLEKAINLYSGHFLAADGSPWAASPRERLQNKFLRAVSLLGNHWEHSGKYSKAIEYYQKGLEVDHLAEELYQYLMLCYQKLGRKTEAVKTYRRCRDMLQTHLGVEPSQETEEIYRGLGGASHNQSKKRASKNSI